MPSKQYQRSLNIEESTHTHPILSLYNYIGKRKHLYLLQLIALPIYYYCYSYPYYYCIVGGDIVRL